MATSSPRPSPITQPSLAKRGSQSSLLLLLLWPSPGDTGPSQAVILLWGGGLAYLIPYLTSRGWGWQSIACGYELGVSPSSTTLWLPRVSPRVLTQVISAPKGHWVMSGTSLVIMTGGGGALLALSGWGQGGCSTPHRAQDGPTEGDRLRSAVLGRASHIVSAH